MNWKQVMRGPDPVPAWSLLESSHMTLLGSRKISFCSSSVRRSCRFTRFPSQWSHRTLSMVRRSSSEVWKGGFLVQSFLNLLDHWNSLRWVTVPHTCWKPAQLSSFLPPQDFKSVGWAVSWNLYFKNETKTKQNSTVYSDDKPSLETTVNN